MKTKSKALGAAIPRQDVSLFDELDRAFDRLMHRGWRAGWMHPFREMWPEWNALGAFMETGPRVDMIDHEHEILVRAEVPGVAREDLELELAGRMLTLSGERREEKTAGEGTYFQSEIVHGTFSRTIALPEEVDLERVRADFRDGILEIHLPKTQQTARRRIAVEPAAHA